jgi:Flp pilus assembly pilin Flp
MYRVVQLSKPVLRWLKIDSERGVSAVEYGLLAALIALVMMASASYLGNRLSGLFYTLGNNI